MTFFGKLGHAFRALGSKVTGAASFLGHKIGKGLLSVSPLVTAFNPALGAGVATAGAVAEGIGALGDVGQSMLAGGIGPGEVARAKAAVGQVRSGASQLKGAYAAYANKSPLERG